MRHTLWVIMFGFVCFGMSGCGSSQDTPAAATTTLQQPEEVLQEFLTAVKAGSKAQAENLLTAVARQKTAAEGIGIGNISSSTMSFSIQGVQPLVMPDGKEAAHVSCVFSEKMDDDKTESHNIIWALRKETVGWRVAGMAWTPFAGEPPIFMDFEDPADMLRKQQLLAEEQERRANPQAAQPATTVAGTPAAAVGTTPAVQPQSGVVQATNNAPTTPIQPGLVQPGTTDPIQQAPGSQQAERFTAPAPLR